MPRSKTRARLRAANAPDRESSNPMDDDSGRTPERMAYLRRNLAKRLKIAAALRVAREVAPSGASPIDD
jgi:hypothetical protein